MTIRKKSLLAIVITFVSLIVILFAISRFILLENLREVEEESTRQNVERAVNALSYTLSDLKSTTTDWASWDDTYTFIKDGNSEYIKTNLVDGTFIALRLNLMLFVNSSGQTVFSKAFDLHREEEIQVPQSLQAHLSGDSPLLSRPDMESRISGILLLPKSPPLLIASRPILTSEDEGPIRGTLIFGRYLESAEVNRLGELTSLSLATYRVGDVDVPSDVREVYSSLLGGMPILSRPLDGQHIAGYSLIKDIYGRPGLVVKVDMLRDIYQQGQLGVTYLILAITAVGVVLGVVATLLADKLGLSRLKHLAETVESIGTSGNISERVSATGRDEISSLAGSINGMLAVLQQAEDELREREQRYQSIFETTGAAMVIADEDTILSLVNTEFEKLSGYSKEELEGKKGWVEFVKPGNLDKAKEYYSRWGKEPKDAPQNFECRFVNRDGNVRDILLNVNAIPGTKMYVASLLDITERKQAETALKKLYKQEKGLRQELETEMRRRVEFTRALVHELKTPLTPVLTSSDMLTTELKQEPLLSLAKNINRGAVRLNNRIDELLDLARGEIGTLRLAFTRVEPSQLLRDVVDEMAPAASRRKQSLELDLPPYLSPVRGDEERLRQVIVNLLSNACKFTPEGGKITVKAKESDAFLTVEVQDTGLGLSDGEQQRLFKPYYRSEDDRQRLSGLGLGLALCKTLVELHSGKIWVQSRVGEGSTFGFSVPLETTKPGRET